VPQVLKISLRFDDQDFSKSCTGYRHPAPCALWPLPPNTRSALQAVSAAKPTRACVGQLKRVVKAVSNGDQNSAA